MRLSALLLALGYPWSGLIFISPKCGSARRWTQGRYGSYWTAPLASSVDLAWSRLRSGCRLYVPLHKRGDSPLCHERPRAGAARLLPDPGLLYHLVGAG